MPNDKILEALKRGIEQSRSINCVNVGIDSGVVDEESNEVLASDDFSKEKLKNSQSDRNLREGIENKISIMMICELAFTGILLFGIFSVPYLNSLAPVIKFNTPPLFITLSILVIFIYLYKFVNSLPFVRISCRKLKLKKTSIDLSLLLKFMITALALLIINIYPREPHTINFNPIILPENIIRLILLLAETVFVKTTVLIGMIIAGLFQNENKKSKPY